MYWLICLPVKFLLLLKFGSLTPEVHLVFAVLQWNGRIKSSL